jgi:hypothetical protein
VTLNRRNAIDGEFLGRVSSVSQALSMGLSPLGLMAAGIVLDRVGGSGTLIRMGALLVLASGMFALSGGVALGAGVMGRPQRRGGRRRDDEDDPTAEDAEGAETKRGDERGILCLNACKFRCEHPTGVVYQRLLARLGLGQHQLPPAYRA